MSYITSAIGGISDEHIAEFAFAKPRKVYTGVVMKAAAAAACLAVIIAAVPLAGKIISGFSVSSFPSYAVTDCWADPDNENNARVVFNGTIYLFDNDDLSRAPSQLNSYYEHVGDVLTVDPKNSDVDGYSLGCSVGDPIYMDPDFPGMVYVFTHLASGDNKYIRFTDRTTHKTFETVYQLLCDGFHQNIQIDNKYYFCVSDHFNQLPDRYVLIYSDDNEGEIFQDPDHPEEIYIYESHMTKEYFYWRYLDFEAFRQDGKYHMRLRELFLTAQNYLRNGLI